MILENSCSNLRAAWVGMSRLLAKTPGADILLLNRPGGKLFSEGFSDLELPSRETEKRPRFSQRASTGRVDILSDSKDANCGYYGVSLGITSR